MFKKISFRVILSFILIAICTPLQSQARSDNFTPGFKTIGIWQSEQNIRIDINIWYPSIRIPRIASYGSWKINVAKNGKKAEGIFPLILLSHDSAGGRFSYHTLAAFLAKNGFIVVAPTHYGDNINNMSSIYTIYQIIGRVEQLNTSLDTVLNDKFFKNSINKNKIGILGFGVGGTAALILGGATLDPNGWTNFCNSTQKDDNYCTPWAKARINRLVSELPIEKNLANPQIKAVAIITPSYGMLFSSKNSQNFTSPLLIVKAEEDTINLAPFHADALRNIFSEKVMFAIIKKADNFALMSSCPPELQRDLEDMCTTVSPKKRRNIHSQLYPLIEQFFSTALK